MNNEKIWFDEAWEAGHWKFFHAKDTMIKKNKKQYWKTGCRMVYYTV